jgi:hypothetical protein
MFAFTVNATGVTTASFSLLQAAKAKAATANTRFLVFISKIVSYFLFIFFC